MTKTHAEFFECVKHYALVQAGTCVFHNKEIEKELWLKLARSVEQIEQFQVEQEAKNENN